jgi:LuxR family quorum-sensing system transcriptional regulator SolR
LLDNFSTYFTKAAASLIERASLAKLILPRQTPDAAVPQNFDGIHLKQPKRTNYELLTIRQLQIAKLMIEGRTARQIGDELGLSPRTVESHIGNMKSRLMCNNKADLFIRFSNLGLIETI